ncbi:hypothetical protein [Streptomyces sp. NPDC049040]|uniref:hypothetical protein n=1 Tax=Streptomyces sp. NPDC049040 TaxID=3365593 RepID=UPI0037189742
MKSAEYFRRFGAVVTAFAAAVALGVLVPASAEAAAQIPTYWTFSNSMVGNGNTCLTGGNIQSNGTAHAFMATCNGSFFQQWDWRGSDDSTYPALELQNKATGLCLATDHKSYDGNAVWVSRCDWSDGRRFMWMSAGGGYHYLLANLNLPNVFLTPRESGAVYANNTSDAYMDSWVGSHS